MSFVAVAIGGSALIGVGGSIFGGMMAKKGADAAGRQYGAWGNSAVNSINNAWGATHETTAPWIQMGQQSGQRLLNGPVGGTNFTQDYSNLGDSSARTLQALLMGGDVGSALQNSPMFRWQQEQGERDINRQLAARGMYNSGAGMETLARFNAQLQADEGNRIFDRLFSSATMGLNAAQVRAGQEQNGLQRLLGLTQIGGNMAGQQARHYQDIGIALGNAKLGVGTNMGSAANQGYQAIGQAGVGAADALSGAVGQFGQYQMMQPLLSRLGGTPQSAYSANPSQLPDPSGLQGVNNYAQGYGGDTGLDGVSQYAKGPRRFNTPDPNNPVYSMDW